MIYRFSPLEAQLRNSYRRLTGMTIPVEMCIRDSTYAVAHSRLPLCYNGDLFSPQDCWDLARQFPSVDRLMAGRGLVCNPALGRQLQGGPPLTKAELQAFHDRLLDGYQSVLSGDWPVPVSYTHLLGPSIAILK